MGGGSSPEPVRQDPEADAERIAAEAAVAANSQAARRKKTRRQQSLVLSEPAAPAALGAGPPSGSVLSYGKTTLGG